MSESLAGGSERDELRPLRPRWEWSADEIKRIDDRVTDMIEQNGKTILLAVFAAATTFWLLAEPSKQGKCQ